MGSALGGGGRDLGETWTRLEADPIIEADPFSGGHWTPSRGVGELGMWKFAHMRIYGCDCACCTCIAWHDGQTDS